MELIDQIKNHLASVDWRVALQLEDALACVGEGKRLAAALGSARTRHATNVAIAARRIQYQPEKLRNGYRIPYGGHPFAEIIIASEGGAWTGRRYEIHIPFWLEKESSECNFNSRDFGMDYAFLVTSSGNGEGTYKYSIPVLAAWNVLRAAVSHAGELRACQEGLVEVFEAGGYEDPLNRDEKPFSEYFELGWGAVAPQIEEGLSADFFPRRELVLEWDDYESAPQGSRDGGSDPADPATPLPDVADISGDEEHPLADWERDLLEGENK